MKIINKYISEKLKIGSKSQINKQIDVDNINRQEICLTDMKEFKGKSMSDILSFVENDKSYEGFLLSRHKELSEYIKEGNSQNISYHVSLDMLLEDVEEYFNYNGNYDIWIEYGRILIKDYKRKFYIYGLSKYGYNKCEETFEELDWRDRKNHDLNFMKGADFILEIKYEKKVMKLINNFIQEKLKISSNSKVNTKIIVNTKGELKRELLKKRIEGTGDLKDIDVSNIEDLSELFEYDDRLTNIDITGWNTSKCKTMKSMFHGCRFLKTVKGLENLDISNVKDMSFLFSDCKILTDIGNLENWDVSNINMHCAFQNCQKLKTIGNIRNWNLNTANWDVFANSIIYPQPPKKP